MSNALALASVTQALALLIENNLRPEIDMAVSVETRKPPAEPPTEPTITVFLYQVAPNPGMRNSDLPTRAPNGDLRTRPAAALDLNYLISAYGEEAELVGQRLIGCVVRTLHEIPVLPEHLIEQAAQRPYLAGSDLAESAQQVRFSPLQMDIDETSKLWGMLHQTPYSLSVAYQGSLVFVEGRERPVPAKPVEHLTTHAAPFGTPQPPTPRFGAAPADHGRKASDVRAEDRAEDGPKTSPKTSSAAEAPKPKRTTRKTSGSTRKSGTSSGTRAKRSTGRTRDANEES